MATAKLEIATGGTHPREAVAAVLRDYFSSGLARFNHLFGGYSGSNYRVELDDGSVFVMKVTNGYSADHAELMCRTAHHLEKNGFVECCRPVPKLEGARAEYEFVSLREPSGVPAFVLTFVAGKQADKVMRDRPDLSAAIMEGIGGGLARMHVAAAGITKDRAIDLGLRWYQESGGCCGVQDHVDGTTSERVRACPASAGRESFPSFYGTELRFLREEMAHVAGGRLELGITHGDPFADNVLVDGGTGALSAFIDIEDFCVGPLLFDLACCAVGCCFCPGPSGSKHPQVMDFGLFTSLLKGYRAHRTLPDFEKEHLLRFMRVALLCNCSWRFLKFNSGGEFPEQAKASYLELQRRIEYLHDTEVINSIEKLLVNWHVQGC